MKVIPEKLLGHYIIVSACLSYKNVEVDGKNNSKTIRNNMRHSSCKT